MKEKIKRKKGGIFSKRNCGWTKVQQKYEKKKKGKLTSETTKLTAIAPWGRRSKTWGLLEEVLAGVLRAIKQCRRQESRVGAVE